MKNVFAVIIFICAVTAGTLADDAAVPSGNLPKVAVYVTGNREMKEKRVLATYMLEALMKSGRYVAIERSERFLGEIDKEQEKQRSGAIDDAQISQAGRQSGVDYVCVVDIAFVLNSYQISARLIDVETAKVEALGVAAESKITSMDEIRQVAYDAVGKMLGEQLAAEQTPGKGEAEVVVIGPGGNFSSGSITVLIDGKQKGAMRGDGTFRAIIPVGARHLSVKWHGDGTFHELKKPKKFTVKEGARTVFRVKMKMFGPITVSKSKG